jgi:signal transduction histidine kinase
MTKASFLAIPTRRAWIITLAIVYVLYAAVLLRTMARTDIQFRLPVYLIMEFICLVLFTLMLWRPIAWQPGQHLYFAFQALLILTLLMLNPKFDFVAVLFVILALEAALIFPRHIRPWWIIILILLIFVPLTTTQGMYGLALSLTPIAGCLIFSAYVSVNQEIERGITTSQKLIGELREANQQLTAYTAQVEELSIIQEHNRLARELHDSISQSIHKIIQINQTARFLLEGDPDQLSHHLDELQQVSQNSLEQMRELITSLRPAQTESSSRPSA